MNLPKTETILLSKSGIALFITLNRPESRNAMSLQMVNELMAVFEIIKDDTSVRAVVLRGAGGHFCAGGDIKDMGAAHVALAAQKKKHNSDVSDPFYQLNRQFGRLITAVNSAPHVVIAVLEGAVLGGGFGLACVSDIAIASAAAKFGLPESGLGIPPAQIAPFVVARIGLTQARRLALLGVRFDGNEAKNLGIVHYACADSDAIDKQLNEVLSQVNRCAPLANRMTKEIILAVGSKPLEKLLDDAALQFSQAVQGCEGVEGTTAFIEKRDPNWFA